ncbi:MAG: hypothetical protein ACXWAT_00015 [Methylobacter sp.]
MAVGKKTGGRQKGTQNKQTKELKDMLSGALEAKGGQKWIEKQMDENPTAVLSLLGKTLPKAVDVALTGANGGPVKTITKIELVPFGHDSTD